MPLCLVDLQEFPESDDDPNFMEQSYGELTGGLVAINHTTDGHRLLYNGMPKAWTGPDGLLTAYCSDILCGLWILSISLNNSFLRGE